LSERRARSSKVGILLALAVCLAPAGIVVWLPSSAWAGSGGLGTVAGRGAAERTSWLGIDSQAELPDAFRGAVDVRWTRGEAVYLALMSAGVKELPLPVNPVQAKEVIPGKRAVGGVYLVYRVAASSEYIVAGPPAFAVTWRRLDEPGRLEEAFEYVQAIDVRDRQLAILGLRSDEQRNFSPDGAIAWTGSLDKRLRDLRPVAFSATGPGAAAAMACSSVGLGAIRYLTDGSLLVVPGTQPGAIWLDATGKVVRVFDNASVGIDTDCARLSHEQAVRFASHPAERLGWVNQRRTVDSILPLTEGAGVVVRIAEAKGTRWELRRLRRDGTWAASALPFQGASAYAHLHGDARGRKGVFLLYEDGWGFRPVAKPQLFVVDLGL
jgi:hypothetical protein